MFLILLPTFGDSRAGEENEERALHMRMPCLLGATSMK